MADNAPRDQNRITGTLAESSAGDDTTITLYADPTTHRLLTDAAILNASGTSLNGNQVTVGATEVQMTFTGTTISLMIQADHDNTGSIWVGPTGVTTTGANALVRLEAGESFSVDLDDDSMVLYAISDLAAQKIYKSALT